MKLSTRSKYGLRALMDLVERNPQAEIRIDLASGACEADGVRCNVSLPPNVRDAFATGAWDTTGLLLERYQEVDAVAARLQRDFVIGTFNAEDSLMIGVGGLAWSEGVKTRHKALLYGMYVKAADRGSGAADEIMKRLIEEARGSVEIVTLTVVSTNFRALRFYERWGFRAYGVEERSAKNGDGDYLDETLMALRFADEKRRQDESR